MAFTPSKPGNENNSAEFQTGIKATDPVPSAKRAAPQQGKFEDASAASLKTVAEKTKRVTKRKGDDEDPDQANLSSVDEENVDSQAAYADEPMLLAAADTGGAEAVSSGEGAAEAGAVGAEGAAGASVGAEGAAGGAAAAGAAIPPMGAIIGAVAAVGIAASGGGGGGGAAAASGFTLSGSIVLGKINDATGLVVEAFKADGTLLAGGTGTVNADGTYSIAVTENYSGPVLIRLKDTSAGTNYIDEGTGAAKDLGTDLRAVVNVSGNGTITVAITPLTELAVRELVGDTGGDAGAASTTLGSVSTSDVTAANDNVKTAFGLSGDITSTVPVTVDDATAFNAGSSAQQAYGRALAAIAGAEVDQGASTGEVLTALSQGLVGSTLSIAASEDLLAGAAVADSVVTNVTGTAAALEAVIGANIGNVALSADTGDVDDFITQTAAQTITATLDAALSGTKLWGSVDGGTSWTDITASVSGTALNWTGVTLASGDNLIKFAVTADTVSAFTGASADVVGKISAQAYALDATAPIFTSGTSASFAENGTGAAYDAGATDAHLLVYTIGGADAALFNIDAASGVVSFKTTPNFEAPADADPNNVFDITVTATDDAGNATVQSVAITVTNANEAPSLTSGASASFAENGTGTVYTATATDPDASTTLTYALAGTDAALFNIDAATGAVTFKTSPNFEAPADSGGNNVYDITVTASDGSITTSAQAVAITVTNVNETPTITSAATANFAENGTGVAYTATATDPDASTTLVYALGGTDAALFDLNTSTGAVTFKTAPNREAPADAGGDNVYDITVTASDGSITTSAQAVAITVTNVNEAPTSTTVTATTAVTNQAYSFDASGNFSDPDTGTTLSYSATGLPVGLTISSAGVISGTATTEALTNSVTVTATDGSLTTSQTFNLAVVSAPVITAVAANVTQADSGDALIFTATLSEAVTVTGTPTLTFDVGGQSLTATYTGGDGTNTLTFSATVSAGDDTSVTVSAISVGAGSVIGNVSAQPLVTGSVGQVVASFLIDNSNPSFSSAITANFQENGTGSAYTAAASDATAVTYSLGSTGDNTLFDINSSTGAVTFKVAPNFEAPTDAGANGTYDITVTATDALGHAASQNVAITLTNQNEAPTSSPATSTETIVVNQSLTGDNIADLFSDVDAGDTLTFTATGLPTGVTLAANGDLTGTPTTLGTANVVFTATDSGGLTATHSATVNVVAAPTIASSIDNVTNFEVTSNIVLTGSENLTAVAGKYIHIINDGGTGFHGEATVNTQDILVTDTSKVTISNNTITINPGFDLDFNNDYHIMIDDGAFLGASSGQGSVATATATAMNFSTVNPSATSTAVASQAMTSGTDAMVAGHSWWDAEGNGVPGGASVARDFSGGDFAIAANDLATTGIATNDFYIAVNNFAAGDLIYVDNHGDNGVQRQSDFNSGLIVDLGVAPTSIITAASGTSTGLNGGQFDVTVAGTTASFSDTTALKVLLGGVSYEPVLYG